MSPTTKSLDHHVTTRPFLESFFFFASCRLPWQLFFVPSFSSLRAHLYPLFLTLSFPSVQALLDRSCRFHKKILFQEKKEHQFLAMSYGGGYSRGGDSRGGDSYRYVSFSLSHPNFFIVIRYLSFLVPSMVPGPCPVFQDWVGVGLVLGFFSLSVA